MECHLIIYEISLPQNTPNFEITTVIADENLRIRIRSLNSKTYMDLSVNNNVIFQGLRCDANIDMTESFKYKSVKGALIFDTESTSDVYYTGFGSDYKLYYIVN